MLYEKVHELVWIKLNTKLYLLKQQKGIRAIPDSHVCTRRVGVQLIFVYVAESNLTAEGGWDKKQPRTMEILLN